jgi:tetratricopeptide (TPR) repeat protein
METDPGTVLERKRLPMTRLKSLLSRDPVRSTVNPAAGKDSVRAMEAFAKAGQWLRAAQLAAEMGDDEKLVRYCLMSAVGQAPKGESRDLLGTAERLAAKGRHQEAMLLFERADVPQRAAESARAVRDPLRAAQYYKQAGSWLEATRCLEESGRTAEALQMVEEGCRTLEKMGLAVPGGAGRLAELVAVRVDLLVRLGRGDTAVRLLSSMPPSARTAELLERAGQPADAVEHYLKLGLTDEASRVAARSPERERLQARIFLRTGRPAEAGDLLARLGKPREAAEAYEAALDWGRAAYRWEAAGDPLRAAQAYEKTGRARDAARCYEAAGMPQKAVEVAAGKTPPPRPASTSRQPSRNLQIAQRCLEAGDKTRAASLLLQMQPDEAGFAEGALLLAPLLIDEGFAQDALGRLIQIPREAALSREMDVEYWVGRSHEAMGQKEAAIACLERVIARAPGFRDTRERLLELRRPVEPPATVSFPEAAQQSTQVVPIAAFPMVGGRLAERYELLAELGRGGMGRVYKARDHELEEVVAIKTLLSPDDGFNEESRLLREVQICRRISHPNVVRVYDIGRFAGGVFVTMEYIEGTNLEKMIEQESPLPFERIRSWLAETAAGLQEAHAQGIIHRDLKPANLMVTSGGRLKILDFGIASMAGLSARLTLPGNVVGTPMYMSPDQLLGREPDGRWDLYSLGVVAYTLIAGREPFDAVEPAVLALKQLQETPPDVRSFRPETPPEWAALLDLLLAKDASQRLQTAGDVLSLVAKLPA